MQEDQGHRKEASVKFRPHREIDLLSCVRDISATLAAGRPSYGTDLDPLGGLRQLERLVRKYWWLRRRGYQTQIYGQWRRWVIVIQGGRSTQVRPPRGKTAHRRRHCSLASVESQQTSERAKTSLVPI